MTDTTKVEVSPCPFCRKSNLCVDQFGYEKFAVSCEDATCMAIGPEGRTREEALDKWNRTAQAAEQWRIFGRPEETSNGQ